MDFGEAFHFHIINIADGHGAQVIRLVRHVVQIPFINNGPLVFGTDHFRIQSVFYRFVIILLLCEIVHQRHPIVL